MQLRLRKDGGYSECNAPDDLVGKGRCVHILGGNNNLNVQRLSRGFYCVEIDDSYKTSDKDSKKNIKSFFDQLPKIDSEKKDQIIKQLTAI